MPTFCEKREKVERGGVFLWRTAAFLVLYARVAKNRSAMRAASAASLP